MPKLVADANVDSAWQRTLPDSDRESLAEGSFPRYQWHPGSLV